MFLADALDEKNGIYHLRPSRFLWMTCFKDPVGVRDWKGQDWETMERLHANGFLSDPNSKAKSVALSDEGLKRSKELLAKHFSLKS